MNGHHCLWIFSNFKRRYFCKNITKHAKIYLLWIYGIMEFLLNIIWSLLSFLSYTLFQYFGGLFERVIQSLLKLKTRNSLKTLSKEKFIFKKQAVRIRKNFTGPHQFLRISEWKQRWLLYFNNSYWNLAHKFS